jgi:rare lipoprotein A (peptidoglycan hydrolase)
MKSRFVRSKRWQVYGDLGLLDLFNMPTPTEQIELMNQKTWRGFTTKTFLAILGTIAFHSNFSLEAVASNVDSSTERQISETSETIDASDRMNSLSVPLAQIAGKPKPSKTLAAPAGAKQMRGIASWYGPGFHGRQTANGERFNQNDLTAAHRSLPFGTRVKVTNMNNGRSVVVRINDRGPFAGGRVIDLSSAAANAIGLKGSGVGPVNIQILGR